jgi:hypothetical protein
LHILAGKFDTVEGKLVGDRLVGCILVGNKLVGAFAERILVAAALAVGAAEVLVGAPVGKVRFVAWPQTDLAG